MKVLLFDTTNAFLTPGGKAVHAIKLQQELSKIGVEIEFSRWWDKSQENCDLIHFLTPNTTIAKYAKLKGKKTFLSMIFDFESSKTAVEQKKTIFKTGLLISFQVYYQVTLTGNPFLIWIQSSSCTNTTEILL